MAPPSLRSSSACSSESSVDSLLSSSHSSSLRIFLVQTAKGLFSSSGGYKSNFAFLRYLASRGHSVRQLCYSHHGEVSAYIRTLARSGGRDPQHRLRQLQMRSEDLKSVISIQVDELVLENGVQIVSLDKDRFDVAFGGKENILKMMCRETAAYIEEGQLSPRLHDFVSFLQREITTFSPTHVVFNDGLTMQATSTLNMPSLSACRIAVIHTAEQLPFGPFCGGMPGHVSSPSEAKLLLDLDGIWSVSKAIQKYALQHGRLATKVFAHHPWTYLEEKDHGMPVYLQNWSKKYVGMINPCDVKGAQVLANLADLCPQHEFLVYKSWGFDTKVGDQLKRMRNTTVRPSCTDMEEAWRDIKVLLVPSLWFEAWGIVVIEAHLRGIPVISSDAGALPETMLGLDYVIPVSPIRGERDEQGEYIVPTQDIQPWVEAVDKLMSDKSEYERLSKRSRSVTEQWLREVDEGALEAWLRDLENGKKSIR